MKNSSGFSLIEITVALSLMLIGLALAAPDITRMLKENKLQAQLDKFIIAINFTRSEAIKRNQNVVMCPRKDDTTCDTLTWEKGWLIYTDVDASGTYTAGDTILKQELPLPPDITIRATAGSTFENALVYNQSGRASGAFDFVFCDGRGFLAAATRVIEVNSTGRAESVLNQSLATPYTDCVGN